MDLFCQNVSFLLQERGCIEVISRNITKDFATRHSCSLLHGSAITVVSRTVGRFFQLDVLLAFGQHLHAFTVFPISKMLQPHGDSDFLSSELLRF